jgi:uncharacterized protein YecE (DUF72 family)
MTTWAAGGEPSDAVHLSPIPARWEKRDVLCYFDNDQKVEAPFDAQRLKRRVAAAEQTGATR